MELPKIPMRHMTPGMKAGEKIDIIVEYLQAFEKQARHVLSHLEEDNLGQELTDRLGAASREANGNAGSGAAAKKGRSLAEGTDFNSVLTVGTFYVQSNDLAATMKNCPSTMAGTLTVKPAFNHIDGIDGIWEYLIQQYEDYTGSRWTRGLYSDSTGAVVYFQWEKDHSLSEIMLSIYPVGAIYISTVSTNPGTLFGGTWEQLKDRFLLGAGDAYAAGNAGGEATHALTVAEMPKHAHKVFIWNQNNTSFDGYQVTNDGRSIAKAPCGAVAPNGVFSWANDAFKTAGNDNLGAGYVSGTTGVGDPSGNTHFVGSDTAHNNMPPYMAVYMWKRTA